MAYLPVIIVFVLYFSSIPIAYALFGCNFSIINILGIKRIYTVYFSQPIFNFGGSFHYLI